MEKLTAEEKLKLIRLWIDEDTRPSAHPMSPMGLVLSVIDCPYGNPYHHQKFSPMQDGTPRDQCPTCAKRDGSECVDEFLAAWDQRGFIETSYDRGLHAAVTRMREWRAGKGK